MALYDRVKSAVSGTPGTGAVTLAAAATGYRTFASAAVPNGTIVSYLIEDGANWEIGHGTYNSTANTLTRTNVIASSASGAAITATSAALVSLTALASDINGVVPINGLRIDMTIGEGYFAYAMAEVVLLDGSGSTIAWPTSTVFSASDAASGTPASSAADGDPTTFWGTSGFGVQYSNHAYWWLAQFPAGVFISPAQIAITARPVGSSAGPQTPQSFGFRITLDGVNYTMKRQVARTTDYADGETRTFSLY